MALVAAGEGVAIASEGLKYACIPGTTWRRLLPPAPKVRAYMIRPRGISNPLLDEWLAR